MFVKVCGLSTPESVREAVAAGADAVGFVLTASPRVVSPSQAAALLAEVPAGVTPIGVFRDEPLADAAGDVRAGGDGERAVAGNGRLVRDAPGERGRERGEHGDGPAAFHRAPPAAAVR